MSLRDSFAARRAIPSSRVLCQEVSGEAVLLDLESEQYFGLDEVGVRIWQLLNEHGNLQQVFETLVKEYEADPEEIARDLETLVAHLVESKLVTLESRASKH